jgi:hypothetical protein
MEFNFATVSAIVGILGGILGILNQLHSLRKSQEEQVKAQAIRDTKLDDKLEQIDRRLTEHNNYASMFADVKESIIEMRNDIKWIKESK